MRQERSTGLVISREVALTEVWLDEQARLREGNWPARIPSRVWVSEIGKALVWFVGLVLLILGMALLAPESRGDTVSVGSVASILDTGSVLPLADGVDTQLASNLLRAQQQTWGREWLDGSLELSIESVLRAIGLYLWPGGPEEITRDNADLVWLQSHIAIDPRLSVGFDTTAINFGEVAVVKNPPVSTPEPDVALLLLLGLVLGLPIPWIIRDSYLRSERTVIVARLRAYREVRP